MTLGKQSVVPTPLKQNNYSGCSIWLKNGRMRRDIFKSESHCMAPFRGVSRRPQALTQPLRAPRSKANIVDVRYLFLPNFTYCGAGDLCMGDWNEARSATRNCWRNSPACTLALHSETWPRYYYIYSRWPLHVCLGTDAC